MSIRRMWMCPSFIEGSRNSGIYSNLFHKKYFTWVIKWNWIRISCRCLSNSYTQNEIRAQSGRKRKTKQLALDLTLNETISANITFSFCYTALSFSFALSLHITSTHSLNTQYTYMMHVTTNDWIGKSCTNDCEACFVFVSCVWRNEREWMNRKY